MDDENGTRTGRKTISVNQVVAWNMARYRRAAGLTQKDLGDRLGWTNAAVSEAERSWDGKRTREFDAQTLAHLSLALNVPLVGFFIPPEDDGKPDTYVFSRADGGEASMTDLVRRVIMPDSPERDPDREPYRERFRNMADRYLGRAWAREIALWLMDATPEEKADARIARFRFRQAQAELMAQEYGDIVAALESHREPS